MLKNVGLPTEFWGEAVTTAVYLENRTPMASLKFKSPFELWNGVAPTYDHLRTFGCLAYVHVGKERREGKFSDTAVKGIMLGYQESHRNYRIYLLNEKRIVYSHDVIFNKDCFPMKGPHATFIDEEDPDFTDVSLNDIHQDVSSSRNEDSPASPPMNGVNPSSEVADSNVPIGIVEGGCTEEVTLSQSDELGDQSDSQELDVVTPKLKEINSNIDITNILPTRTRRGAHTAEVAAQAMIVTTPDPKTYHQATKCVDSQEWEASMQR